VTHLGQRLSALIDGELEGSERERVLLHMARCGSCRDEVASLRLLKRRMTALGGEADAGARLTGRLIGLSESAMAARGPMAEAAWPPPQPPGGWGFPDHGGKPDQRTGRYFLAGSVAVFLAGLGTAAFIAGGEAQAQAPSLPVTPSVDVLVVPHELVNSTVSRPARDRAARPGPDRVQPDPGVTPPHRP
jgi:anti-sigma factor RsiW